MFHDITSGVPQGSVLGPLLFLIYINEIVDLFLDNSVQIKLYADDLKVYLEITCDFDNVTSQNCVNNIVEWSEVWKLKLAIDKCQYSHISLSTSSAPAVYFVSDSQLPTTSTIRDLGVIVDNRLTFKDHITSIVTCLLYTSPSPRDRTRSRMPSSA